MPFIKHSGTLLSILKPNNDLLPIIIPKLKDNESESDLWWTLRGSLPILQKYPSVWKKWSSILSLNQKNDVNINCSDIQNYLTERLLVKTDRTTMLSSLEARVPFLDHKIIEWALQHNCNERIKANKFMKKQSRVLLKNYLPNYLVDRKQGFQSPLKKWFSTYLKILRDRKK